MSERFFRSSRQGYPHPVSSELENSGIRVAVGDCSVTERRRWRPPYQTGKTVHVHAKTLQTQRGRTHGAGCVRQCFRTAEPLGERRYENWNTHTQTRARDLQCLVCSKGGQAYKLDIRQNWLKWSKSENKTGHFLFLYLRLIPLNFSFYPT